jgi:hypothetical protein
MGYGWGGSRHAFGPRRCRGFHGHHQQLYFDPVYAVATPVAPTRVVAPTAPPPTIREIPPTPPPPAEPAYEEVEILDEPPPYPGSVKGLDKEFPKELREMSESHYQDPIPLQAIGKDPAYVTVLPLPHQLLLAILFGGGTNAW